MSVIMPSGGKKYNWVPKVAEDEKIGVDAITDEELASLVAPTVEVEDADIAEPGETPEEDVVEVSIEESDEDVDIPETLEDESLESDAGEGTIEERVADLTDDIAAVQEKLEDVVEDAAEVAEMATGEVAEVETEVEDELEEEELVDEIVEVAEGELLTAITPGEEEEVDEDCCQYCGGSHGIASVAGDNRRFTKVGALTTETKSELKKYWVDFYGYDPDYVDAMLTDYEK